MRKHNKRMTSILLATFCSLISWTSSASAATVADSNLVDIPANELQALVSAAYGNSTLYSGLRFDEARHTYILGAVDVNAAAKSLNQLFHGNTANETSSVAGSSVRVEVTKQSRSRNILKSVMSQVAADVKNKNVADGRVTAWHIDEDANQVVIEIANPSDKDVLALRDRYGSGLVRVISGRRPTTAAKVTTTEKPIKLQKASKGSIAVPSQAKSPSRLLDFPAYNSAVRIFTVGPSPTGSGSTIFECTTAMNRASLTQVVTAGHCGPTGTTFYQGYFDKASSTAYYSDILGTVTLSIDGNGDPDFANIQPYVPLSDQQYTSDVVNLEEYVATTQTNDSIKFVVGQSVCTNGSFSGYTCRGATVNAVDICIDTDVADLVCGIDRATSGDGGSIVQSGDSGGPILTGSLSAGAQVGGVIVAEDRYGLDVFTTEASRT
ncbi:hypothetical protein [Amycolatopsis mediterranei]|uniref:hypothetical protein n=1 Tax=Amycolatopsis mediterranei TaxID=33910 RepID=UPI000A4512BE|nr:hypothetical protein [Amycolatopsis mediterranei]UZF70556.1 S1 family peptidase [Amycolatopsis mediterranei]